MNYPQEFLNRNTLIKSKGRVIESSLTLAIRQVVLRGTGVEVAQSILPRALNPGSYCNCPVRGTPDLRASIPGYARASRHAGIAIELLRTDRAPDALNDVNGAQQKSGRKEYELVLQNR
jgi:hypothetical protein